MGLSELEKRLISGMVSSGVDERTILGIMMTLSTKKQKLCMGKWMSLYGEKNGCFPPPELYPIALRALLEEIPTPKEEE
jgi:hypothetical protein